VAIFALGGRAHAVPVTYIVDSSLSSLTLSGGVAGLVYAEQSPGSLTDFWTGTINADLTGGVLTFTGGSTITALLHPGAPFSTAPASPTLGVQNYGVTASGNSPLVGGAFATVNGVYHGLSLDILAGTATDGAAPAGMTIKYLPGSRVDGGIASVPFSGPTGADLSTIAAAANTTASLVSLPVAYTTLTLPVRFTTTGGSGRSETFTGTIVANLIPEPGTGILVVFGLGLLPLYRRHSRQ